MSEKVKVSREVAEAIEWSIKWHKLNRTDLVTIEAIHGEMLSLSTSESFQGEDEEILNIVPTYQLAKMLILGYEIEQTPEEIIFEQYKRKRELMKIGNELKLAHEAYADGIKFVLDTLNIKIDGINSR